MAMGGAPPLPPTRAGERVEGTSPPREMSIARALRGRGFRAMSRGVVEPALFRRFPALARRIPHRPFLDGPTPVERVTVPGVPELFVKRDDRCTKLYGGNKPRKLEFVLGDALARGARRLVTTGGIGTHHGLATAIFARACGLATTLVLVDQPVTAEVRESLRLFAAYGAEVVDARNVPGVAWRGARVLARSFARGE